MAPPRTLRKRNDKYAKNVDKRGNVPIGKAALHDKDPEPPKHLVIIFFILVVGSIFVQVYRMAEFGSKSLKNFSENFEAQQNAQQVYEAMKEAAGDQVIIEEVEEETTEEES